MDSIPALVAEGFVPPDTAFVQSSPHLAVCRKLGRRQTIAVFCTNGCVQGGVEDVAGLVAHGSDLFVQETFGVGQVLPA